MKRCVISLCKKVMIIFVSLIFVSSTAYGKYGDYLNALSDEEVCLLAKYSSEQSLEYLYNQKEINSNKNPTLKFMIDRSITKLSDIGKTVDRIITRGDKSDYKRLSKLFREDYELSKKLQDKLVAVRVIDNISVNDNGNVIYKYKPELLDINSIIKDFNKAVEKKKKFAMTDKIISGCQKIATVAGMSHVSYSNQAKYGTSAQKEEAEVVLSYTNEILEILDETIKLCNKGKETGNVTPCESKGVENLNKASFRMMELNKIFDEISRKR